MRSPLLKGKEIYLLSIGEKFMKKFMALIYQNGGVSNIEEATVILSFLKSFTDKYIAILNKLKFQTY